MIHTYVSTFWSEKSKFAIRFMKEKKSAESHQVQSQKFDDKDSCMLMFMSTVQSGKSILT